MSKNSEITEAVQKSIRDARSAEHGSEHAVNSLIKDVHDEEDKFRNDPAKLAAYKEKLNNELHSARLLLPGIDLVGTQTENGSALGLEFKDKISTSYVGSKDQAMLELLDGRTRSLLPPVKH